MFKEAIKAGLPVVACSSRDMVNFTRVVEHLTGKAPKKWDQSGVKQGIVYVLNCGGDHAPAVTGIYEQLIQYKSTLILVNAKKVPDEAFDAGELPTPKAMIVGFLKEVTGDEGKAKMLAMAVGGCTLKEVSEYANLTMSRDKSLTPEGLNLTRRSVFQGSNGLTQVDTFQPFYAPDPALAEWLASEKPYFLNATEARLRPRGLLFDGPPGTGKSAGAKWLAHQLGVPLFRIDIGTTKDMWHGKSERNMLTSLQRLSTEEPCVALIDEVEKSIRSSHQSVDGTSGNMLASLLWWMAEHKTRVLTVMTTNNKSVIPPELYRPGRIDRVMTIGGLNPNSQAARTFIENVGKSFGVELKEGDVKQIASDVMDNFALQTNPVTVSQSSLTEGVKAFIKDEGLGTDV